MMKESDKMTCKCGNKELIEALNQQSRSIDGLVAMVAMLIDVMATGEADDGKPCMTYMDGTPCR